MDFDYIKNWLTHYNQSIASRSRMCGILGLVLFPIGLAAGVALVFALACLFTAKQSGNPDVGKSIWVALGCIPLMFIGNYLTPRPEKKLGWDHGIDGGIGGRVVGRYKALFGVMSWILFTGPRLLNWSIKSFQAAKETGQQDVHSCAAVLWVLMSRPNRVPLDEIPAALEWLNFDATLPEVQKVPGVLFLQGPPAGLTLSTDLRNAIRANKLPE
jgi:hypothetical protein